MSLGELLLLAVALSMDALAVSICKGMSIRRLKLRHALIVGAWFGAFQAIMPTLGFLLASSFADLITAVDHWVAFALLALIGGNMIRESLSKEEEKVDASLSFLSMLLLALAIHRSSWFNNIARTVLFLPFTVSATAGSIVWSYVFTDVYGTITGLVSPLGMPGQIIYGMVVIGAWRDMGYTMLIYIAALQAVPQDYYEAATVDGAGKLRQFFSVTVPNIVPAFTTNVTLLLAWGLRTFDMPMAVARNAREGQFTAVYVYDSIFSNNKAGLGQAAAVILTIILVVLTQIVTRSLRRLEVEQ